jgi:hypothetical protein
MANPGRFHYFRGVGLVKAEDGTDGELMDQMTEQTGVSFAELLDPAVSREYAMGVVAIRGNEAMLDLTWKQFDPSDNEYNITPETRAAAEDEFRRWASESGYEAVIAPRWARQHLK